MTEEKNHKELSELEKIFFEHFAKKQDNNNDFLLRLLLIISSLIGAYGYLLLKIDEAKYNSIIIFFMLIIVEIFLSIYFKIIYDEGFAFRRDQIVICRILKKHGLISEFKEDDEKKNIIFPYYYNILKKFQFTNGKLTTIKKGEIFLMPAFHNTLAGAIILLQTLLYLSFYLIIKEYPLWQIISFSLLTLYCSINTVVRKHKWLMKLYLDEFEANKISPDDAIL